MKRKKILHVIERFNVAGAEIVVKYLLENLDRNKWDVEVCVLHDIGIIGAELKNQGYAIHYLNWEKENLTDIQLMKKLCDLVKKRKVDILHPHNVTPWYFSLYPSFINRIKQCVTIHGFIRGAGSWKKKILYILLSQFTSRMISVSEDVAKQIRQLIFVNMKKAETIVNGIDIRISNPDFNLSDKKKELGISEDDFIIGTVGRMFPEKNIEMQIRLVHALIHHIPNLKLVVVAKKYSHFQLLEKLVKNLGVQDKIIFTGLRRDVSELLRIFDIFTMTSFSEGTSLALLEAMACGLPVVVSDVGGNSKIVRHEQNGMLFDVNDLESLCFHIRTLYHDHEKRRSLAKQAEDSGKKYTVENMVKKYDRLYRKLLDNTI